MLLRRVRRLAGAAGAVVCAYAAWRLAVRPDACGPVEAVVVAGGWGLSLLPVHAVAYGDERRGPGRTDGGGAVP
ncbi:hypothetical protein DVA86_26050 [Streptomyces armeniacus]|uniref:Uncharacterized protein n=1 Tax=Streptomyces armeniacus TaxID=83291 RepID=A0A345Y188_9ACTN|nr:hypothetical protein DVA86_26050 [Streptomyces armeniacus]